MRACIELLQKQFSSLQKQLSIEDWIKQRTESLANRRAKLKANTKKHKEYKQFI